MGIFDFWMQKEIYIWTDMHLQRSWRLRQRGRCWGNTGPWFRRFLWWKWLWRWLISWRRFHWIRGLWRGWRCSSWLSVCCSCWWVFSLRGRLTCIWMCAAGGISRSAMFFMDLGTIRIRRFWSSFFSCCFVWFSLYRFLSVWLFSVLLMFRCP